MCSSLRDAITTVAPQGTQLACRGRADAGAATGDINATCPARMSSRKIALWPHGAVSEQGRPLTGYTRPRGRPSHHVPELDAF